MLTLPLFRFARTFWSNPPISWYERHACFVGVIGSAWFLFKSGASRIR